MRTTRAGGSDDLSDAHRVQRAPSTTPPRSVNDPSGTSRAELSWHRAVAMLAPTCALFSSSAWLATTVRGRSVLMTDAGSHGVRRFRTRLPPSRRGGAAGSALQNVAASLRRSISSGSKLTRTPPISPTVAGAAPAIRTDSSSE